MLARKDCAGAAAPRASGNTGLAAGTPRGNVPWVVRERHAGILFADDTPLAGGSIPPDGAGVLPPQPAARLPWSWRTVGPWLCVPGVSPGVALISCGR
jgi:hypothetical protein